MISFFVMSVFDVAVFLNEYIQVDIKELFMNKNKYFYGEHFESQGDIWSGIFGDVKVFVNDYLEKSIYNGLLIWTIKHKKDLLYCTL